MFPLTTLATTTFSELTARVWNSGSISHSERRYLRSFLLENPLTDEDRAALDRLLHAVRRGWIEILD